MIKLGISLWEEIDKSISADLSNLSWSKLKNECVFKCWWGFNFICEKGLSPNGIFVLERE